MLTLSTGSHALNRRAFLTIGSLGLGGLTLSSLLAGRARAGDVSGLTRDRAIIFLFQQGGPSQHETFDPKPDAPDGVRTVTGTVPTSLPGVQFGDTFTRLARLAHKFTVVRSFQTNNGGHNLQPIVGPDTLNANIGSLYSRVVGATRPQSGMPTNTVVFPDAVCNDVLKGKARGDIAATGPLGAVHSPFIPGSGGQLQQNMRLTMPKERLQDRQQLLEDLSRLNRRIEAEDQGLIDDLRKQAYQVLLSGGVADALDLSKEDPKTVARYDTRQYTRPDGWSQANRGKQGLYTGHAKALGKQLLLARRLCEAGCGFVTIHAGYDGVWDMHADGNNLNMKDGMEAVGLCFDHAVAAFIEDVEARGLSDRILLICCGEMGRTPKLNKNGGRDHWPKLSPLLLYGGGIPAGQVIGRSTRDGGEPATDALTPKHLVSTVLHTLFDVGRLRVTSGLTEVARLAEHPALPGLF
jgi:uncharacterized protein (DUF1501 family)